MAIASHVRDIVRNVGTRLPFLKSLIPAGVRQRVSATLYSLAMPDFPDRKYLVSEVFPLIQRRGCKRVLFVGCRMEQTGYWAQFEQLGIEVWSIDVDPSVARFGVPGRHIIGDATDLQATPNLPSFDCIVFNGILGWGINGEVAARHAFRGFGLHLKPGSLLVVGWNTDAADDPLALPEVRDKFERLRDLSMPSRVTFEGSTHVYDLLLRNSSVLGVWVLSSSQLAESARAVV